MNENYQRALVSLEGLSVGDAWGECFFFSPDLVYKLIKAGVIPGPHYDAQLVEEYMMYQVCALREVPANPPWKWTDDTAMARVLTHHLREFGSIKPDELAREWGLQFLAEPSRGYGVSMHELLPDLALGGDWRTLSQNAFGGTGSFGNGAAMRVAPLGAFFADDLEAVKHNATLSAQITHAHHEGICGAIAVAVGAALAWQLRDTQVLAGDFLELILPHVPPSVVRDEIVIAQGLPNYQNIGVEEVVEHLGNGEEIIAQDTVPFVLWAASQHLNAYEEALWLTVSALGDRDTNCAMVGGIVALSTQTPIPQLWIDNREALPL